MIQPKNFFESLRQQGFSFFAGVPDSLLKSICAYITDNTEPQSHVITANEGNAIALAAGHYLGTGKPAVAYMQNSGIGNAVNPLLSLADEEVYQVPMLLLIGWRGEPGVKDEPQHVKQGRVMTQLLDAMEIPWFQITSKTAAPDALIQKASEAMLQRKAPVVILVSKGAFEPYKLQNEKTADFPLTREDAVKLVASLIGKDDVIVSTTGMTSRELFEFRAAEKIPHNKDFLTVGSMGHASSIAQGIAIARPEKRVVCLDGDGALIMHMGALAVTGNSQLPNLLHIVVNNGAHDSVGGQPTTGFDIDIPAIAKAAGYAFAKSASEPDAITEAIQQATRQNAPALVEIRVRKGSRKDLGRPTSTPVQNKDALMAFIGSA